jgi:transcriptional regulator with XRE-family HTH domain
MRRKIVPTTGERIAAARRAAKLSQAQLAERAGMHRIHLSKLERGVSEPSLGGKTLIALALGRPPAEVFPELTGIIHTVGSPPPAPPAPDLRSAAEAVLACWDATGPELGPRMELLREALGRLS